MFPRSGEMAGYYHLMPTASSMQALDYLTMFLFPTNNRLNPNVSEKSENATL